MAGLLRSAHLMGNMLFDLHLRKWRKNLHRCLDAHDLNSLLFVTVGALCRTPFTERCTECACIVRGQLQTTRVNQMLHVYIRRKKWDRVRQGKQANDMNPLIDKTKQTD